MSKEIVNKNYHDVVSQAFALVKSRPKKTGHVFTSVDVFTGAGDDYQLQVSATDILYSVETHMYGAIKLWDCVLLKGHDPDRVARSIGSFDITVAPNYSGDFEIELSDNVLPWVKEQKLDEGNFFPDAVVDILEQFVKMYGNRTLKESSDDDLYVRKTDRGTFYYKDAAWTRFHREDGPAIIWADGSKEWWFNGERHNESGPAIDDTNGHKAWYVNGEEMSEEEFNKKYGKSLKESSDDKLYVKKIRPRGGSPGGIFYFKDAAKKIPHREDGPAAIQSDGHQAWWFNGKLHNENGPAVIWPSGRKAWYVNGKKLSEEEFNKKYGKTSRK